MNTPLYKILTDPESVPLQLRDVQDFLGTSTDDRWALAVYRITLSDMHVSMLLDSPETENLRSKLPITKPMPAGYEFKAVRGVYSVLKPVTVAEDTWPYSPDVTLNYNSETSVSLIYGNKNIIVPCRINDNVWDIDWPEDTGIKGVLECKRKPEYGLSVTIPALIQYPTATVVEAAKTVDAVTTLLERRNLVDDFYFADSPEEKLAIIVLAMYKETYHV